MLDSLDFLVISTLLVLLPVSALGFNREYGVPFSTTFCGFVPSIVFLAVGFCGRALDVQGGMDVWMIGFFMIFIGPFVGLAHFILQRRNARKQR